MSSQIRNIVIIDLPTVDLWRSAALFPCAKRSRVACESECRWSVRVDTYALRAKNKALLEMRTLIIMQENKVECSRLIEPKKLPLAYRYQQTLEHSDHNTSSARQQHRVSQRRIIRPINLDSRWK